MRTGAHGVGVKTIPQPVSLKLIDWVTRRQPQPPEPLYRTLQAEPTSNVNKTTTSQVKQTRAHRMTFLVRTITYLLD
jgi:hypothetical protein